MLSVFLDSNIFFTDPFMSKNIHNKLLIELAEREFITIYISDVVKKEVINNFEKELVKYYEEIRKSEGKITKMLRTNDRSPIEWKESVDENVAKLKNHFQQLENYGVFEIIPFSNDMLPELVNRSIKRIKPFSERKMEFRDAIIWFSYVDYVKKYHSVKPGYFITKNTDDFVLNGELHPDLQQDSNDFVFYKTPQEFIQNCEEVKQLQKALEIANWVDDQDFPNHPDEVLSLIGYGEWFDKIHEACWNYIYDRPYRILTSYVADYLEPNFTHIVTAMNISVEVVLDTVIITGDLITENEFEARAYNPTYEPGDDEYIYLGSDEVKLEISFTMTINQNKEIEDLDVTHILNKGKPIRDEVPFRGVPRG